LFDQFSTDRLLTGQNQTTWRLHATEQYVTAWGCYSHLFYT